MGQTVVSIKNALGAGEFAPSLFGRQDLKKYDEGTSTCRNFFASYKGGVSTRAGLAYVGTCKQPGSSAPPRDIPFQFSLNQGYVLEFGDQYMRIKSEGAYVTETPKGVTAVSSSGIFTVPAHGYSISDWVYDIGNTGFSGLTWIVSGIIDANNFTVSDLFGNPVTSATASTTGTVSRIYTVTAPYAAVDLPYLKYTQSADVMTLCCVNTETDTEYPPYDLTRHANTNWIFTQESFSANIQPPTNVTSVAQSSTTADTWYSYVVTAVSKETGEESVASSPTAVQNNDISLNAGTNTISWDGVAGASSYNVYKATPSYTDPVPAGVLYGFIGTSLGNNFQDTNIISDFTDVPPTHQDPFARNSISSINITANGSGYTQATVGYSISTSTGSGFVGTPIVSGSGQVVGFQIQNSGEGYDAADTIAITDSGAGTGATASIVLGPSTGTYPAVPAYFQQRRVYASTLNQPDTYFMSQPGLYTNMDFSIPVSPADAITGTPWAQQVNGIQFLVPMPGGLVVLTGKGAWQVNGGSAAAITPSNQTAVPQAYNGCNAIVPPITINYDILYIQSKGSIPRDLAYNFFVNIYTGTDLSVLSSHLFTNYQILQWAWAEEPYKLVWLVRNDGQMLCLTYLKEQDVYSWTRHDTNGLFVGVCSITEPPVDAVYCIVKRYVQGAWRYYSERMDDRIWSNVEQAFCVDSGLSTNLTFPDATLQPTETGATSLSSIFDGTYVGQIIRADSGVGLVTGYTSPNQISVNWYIPVTNFIPNDPNEMPAPCPSGTWSIAPSVTEVSGLNHLEGLEVTILADGSVVSPNQIVTDGKIELDQPASYITIGLPYTCQVQTLYYDNQSRDGNTVQNRRKNISAVGLRVDATRGLSIGADQPDASVQPNGVNVPWEHMVELKERTALNLAGTPIPLFTGDFYQAVTSSWRLEGQVAIQQTYPLPATILSVIFYEQTGDDK